MAVKPGRCVGFDPVQHKASPPPGLIFSTAITIFPLRHSRYLTDSEVRGQRSWRVRGGLQRRPHRGPGGREGREAPGGLGSNPGLISANAGVSLFNYYPLKVNNS